MIFSRPLAACLLLSVLCPHAAAQIRYRVVDLGVLPGTRGSQAQGINNRGDVVGYSGWLKAFVYTDSKGMVGLGTLPGGRNSAATSINDLGQIVGFSDRALFLFTPGKGMRDLGRLDSRFGPVNHGLPIVINNLTEVAGQGWGTGGLEPFHYSPKTGLKSVTPGVKGALYDINDKGDASGRIKSVNGVWSKARGFRAMRLPTGYTLCKLAGTCPTILITKDSEMIGVGRKGSGFYLVSDSPTRGPRVLTSLTKHPCCGSTTYGIRGVNSQGMVVGVWTWFWRSKIKSGTFVYSPILGCVDPNTLVDPKWRIGLLGDVNELGQIAATGRKGVGGSHALRLDPISPAASAVPVGRGCGGGAIPPMLAGTKPQVNRNMVVSFASGTPRAGGALFLGLPASTPFPLGSGCNLYLNPLAPMGPLQTILTDSFGGWKGTLLVPGQRSLLGAKFALQVLLVPTRGPLGLDLSNGLNLTVGF